MSISYFIFFFLLKHFRPVIKTLIQGQEYNNLTQRYLSTLQLNVKITILTLAVITLLQCCYKCLPKCNKIITVSLLQSTTTMQVCISITSLPSSSTGLMRPLLDYGSALKRGDCLNVWIDYLRSNVRLAGGLEMAV